MSASFSGVKCSFCCGRVYCGLIESGRFADAESEKTVQKERLPNL